MYIKIPTFFPFDQGHRFRSANNPQLDWPTPGVMGELHGPAIAAESQDLPRGSFYGEF